MDVDEGVFDAKLGKGSALEGDRLVDLLGKSLVVGEREPDLLLAQAAAVGDHRLNRSHVAMGSTWARRRNTLVLALVPAHSHSR
jgi:hypothetical protein